MCVCVCVCVCVSDLFYSQNWSLQLLLQADQPPHSLLLMLQPPLSLLQLLLPLLLTVSLCLHTHILCFLHPELLIINIITEVRGRALSPSAARRRSSSPGTPLLGLRRRSGRSQGVCELSVAPCRSQLPGCHSDRRARSHLDKQVEHKVSVTPSHSHY